jgi:hypothetical protein
VYLRARTWRRSAVLRSRVSPSCVPRAAQHFRSTSRPDRVFCLDHHIRYAAESCAIEWVRRRQVQCSPQFDEPFEELLESSPLRVALKTAEPESRRNQLKRAENVPEKGLTEAVILDCPRTTAAERVASDICCSLPTAAGSSNISHRP